MKSCKYGVTRTSLPRDVAFELALQDEWTWMSESDTVVMPGRENHQSKDITSRLLEKRLRWLEMSAGGHVRKRKLSKFCFGA